MIFLFKKKIDVDINRPDEKSVITYVASYYHTFARMKNEMKSGRRIANVIIINFILIEILTCEVNFTSFCLIYMNVFFRYSVN